MALKWRPVCLGLGLSLVLGACGGGGGGGSNSPSEAVVDPLSRALQTGNSAGLDDRTLLEKALAEMDRLSLAQQTLVSGLGTGALNYSVPQSSHFVHAAYGNGFTILRGSDDGQSLASAVAFNRKRAAGVGFEFYQDRSGQLGIDAFGQGLLEWLAGGDVPVGITTAGIQSGALTAWLTESFPQSPVQACPAGLPSSCLDGAQVLIISDRPEAGDDEALKALATLASQRGVGVLYVHTRGWGDTTLGHELLAPLGLSLGGYAGNYWVQDTLAWGSMADMLAAMQSQDSLKIALQHFYHHDFPVSFAGCVSGPAKGNCDNDAVLKSALLDGVGELRSQLGTLDRAGTPLFDLEGRKLLKLLVLLGDVWRKEITYPMKKETAPVEDFLRALYADYSVHYLRNIQPAQPDLGSFSAPMSTVPATLALTRQRDVSGSHFTALGAYALPGQTVRVTRQDSSNATIAVRINTQRTGSTRLWSEYNRPRFLASPAMPLAAGETVRITSPYGGTLQLVHSETPDPVTVTVRMEGVARQPFLQYGPGMDQVAFAGGLQNSELTWAEIRTPFAEVHSRRDRMNQSINESRYAGDSQTFLDDLFEYVLRDAYTLAGFQGEGIALPATVAARCQNLGWDCSSASIHSLPSVQHINVDWYAHCGAGCSGNPYDQSWALDPYGWGESHELGHNLQRALLNVYGGRSGEVSNNLFPLHKNWRLLQERSADMSSTRLQYQQAFNILKNGAGSGDAFQAAYDGIWADDSYAANNGLRMAFYIQLPHLWAEVVGDDAQAWDIITLLYLAERQFSRLNDSDWAARKDDFGMGTFATRPDLSGNEFLLILNSFLSGRDLRPLWDQWGLDYGSDVEAQLDALALPAQDAVIWVGPDSNDWSLVQKVPVASDMAWPF
ncbi:ImpA family metalloprotease [Alcanivorax sp. DP30]|uniref:ImpA family metalloprotease n=1 Tax=Alcanivorax sp. DP30 TaxID=2606217 RepID=UPI001367AC8A|nr:ImpA family metalloprotease [Alcanivorax sp. DP30]MZR62788.1 hypothetical protein [Alcanivorax sp. DP30]